MKINILIILVFFVCLSFLFSTKIASKKSFFKPSDKKCLMALLEIYDGQQNWRKQDPDQNGFNDYWISDISGLYFYLNRKAHKEVKYIRKEIALADIKANSKLRKGKKIQPVDYYGYYFRTLVYDEGGFWYAKKSKFKGERSSFSFKFGILATPKDGSNGNMYLINEKSDIYFRKYSRSVDKEKWPNKEKIKDWVHLKE